MRTLLCFAAMLGVCGCVFFLAPHHVQTRRESPQTLATTYDRFFDDFDTTPTAFLPPLFLFGALGIFAAVYPAMLVLLVSSRVGRGWLITAALLAGTGALINFLGLVLTSLKMGMSGPASTIFFWLIPLFQLLTGVAGIALASSNGFAIMVNGWFPPMTGWAVMASRAIVLVICTGVLTVPARRLMQAPPTDAQRLDRFEEKVKSKGSVYRVDLGGKPVAFLMMNCKVYVLTVVDKEVVQDKVLETEFYPWFTVCTHSTLEHDGEFVKVYLAKQAVGAGGGSVGGGNYRSKDGRSWEKKMDDGWHSLADVQH